MKPWFLVIVFFLSIIQCRAQPKTSNYDAIDSFATKVPDKCTRTIDELVHYLIKPAKNDFEKVRALYIWESRNISYDWKAYENGTSGYQSPDSTLKSGKGVCMNFAALFSELCHHAGIACEVITGYARSGIDMELFWSRVNKNNNHDWNAVQIRDKWYLVDVTWGSSYTDFYFLTPPEQFIYSHFPYTGRWQLMPKIMPRETFDQNPFVWERFFQFRVSNVTPFKAVNTAKQTFILQFDSPDTLYISPRLYDLGPFKKKNIEPKYSVRHSGTHYTLITNLPYKGSFLLDLEMTKHGIIWKERVLTFKVDNI